MKTYEFNIQSLIGPVIFFIGGIVAAFYDLFNGFSVLYLLILPILIVSGMHISFRHKPMNFGTNYAISLFLFFTAGVGMTTLQERSYNEYAQALESNPQPTGIVTDISRYVSMDRIGVQIPVSEWWSPRHHFNINLLEKGSSIRKGQTIRINSHLSPIESDINPYSFRATAYWKLHNTSHSIFLYNAADIEILHEKQATWVDQIREKALNRIALLYPDPTQSGILKALLLGQKDGVTKEVKADFKTSGLLHILAVSGLHVGIVSGLLFFLLFPVKFIFPQPWLHYFIVIVALWAYAILTGMNIPVVRAVILMTFYLTAIRINRQSNKWNVFFWAILIVLVMEPKSLFSVSFQLSFSAVGGILMFYRHFNRWLRPVLGQHYFSSLIAVSLAAQLGVFPILLWHFQQVSLVSTLSSLLVIPLLFPLILITTISIILPSALDGAVHLTSLVSQAIVDLLIGISEMLAGWGFSSQVLVWNKTTLVCMFLAVLTAGLYLEYRNHFLRSWVRFIPAVFLVLMVIFESANIYQKRTTPVLNVMEYRKNPIVEFYSHGICYTNYKDHAPDFLVRMRAEYHTRKTVILTEQRQWKTMFRNFRKNSKVHEDHSSSIVAVNDFINQKSYGLSTQDLIAPDPASRPSGSGIYPLIPVLSVHKQNDR